MNTNETDATSQAPSGNPWAALGLKDHLVQNMADMGFDNPTEVQMRAIEPMTAGGDVVVQAKTGSGKTLAFGLPLLQRVDPAKHEVQALILTPTRELCVQVCAEIQKAGKLSDESVLPVYGGASIRRQETLLQSMPPIVVGTPGRLLDHIQRKNLRLDRISFMVLDEADEMLDRGFLPDVTSILGKTPDTRQTCMFSATFPPQIQSLAERFQREPQMIQLGDQGLSVNPDISHEWYKVGRLNKFVCLVNILNSLPRAKVLVFCNTKIDTEQLGANLYKQGFAVGYLSGDLSQHVRDRTLKLFKEGLLDVLVATDVAARGIDIYGISHVVNYDLPENKEMYLHRTGRTARAGRKGTALSLVAPNELLQVGVLSKHLGVKIEENPVPTAEEIRKNATSVLAQRINNVDLDGLDKHITRMADELLDECDAHAVAAALLTFLQQQGVEFIQGFDVEDPSRGELAFVQSALFDFAAREERKQLHKRMKQGGSRDGNRSRRGSKGSRSRKPRQEGEGRSSSPHADSGERNAEKAQGGDSSAPKRPRRRSKGAPTGEGSAKPAGESKAKTEASE